MGGLSIHSCSAEPALRRIRSNERRRGITNRRRGDPQLSSAVKCSEDMNSDLSLIPIDRDGIPRGYSGILPEVTAEVLRATVRLYESVGFREPWVGYLALAGSTPVGTCAFKSAPLDGRIEIAYHTFPGFEGRGLATAMATELVAITWRHEPSVIVAAQTLPERNASHSVLDKLGFRHVATIDHPEDGKVWEWQLAPKTGT